MSGVDISAIDLDKSSDGYRQLMSVTQEVSAATTRAQAAAQIKNIEDKQRIEALNYEESLRIQREEGAYEEQPTVNQQPEENKQETTYILNKNTKKFHYPSCSSVGRMKESNKEYFTGSRDDVIARGYDPCGNCHP